MNDVIMSIMLKLGTGLMGFSMAVVLGLFFSDFAEEFIQVFGYRS